MNRVEGLHGGALGEELIKELVPLQYANSSHAVAVLSDVCAAFHPNLREAIAVDLWTRLLADYKRFVAGKDVVRYAEIVTVLETAGLAGTDPTDLATRVGALMVGSLGFYKGEVRNLEQGRFRAFRRITAGEVLPDEIA